MHPTTGTPRPTPTRVPTTRPAGRTLARTVLVRALSRTVLVRALSRTVLVRALSRTVLVRALFLGTVILAAASSGAVLAACSSDTDAAEPFSGYTRSPAADVSSVSIPAVGGGGGDSFVPVPGSLRLVFFGFTSCPDVCPTTLSDLRRGIAGLDAGDRERVGVDVVTVDPARDLPEVLDAYVRGFLPDATTHRTDDPDLLRRSADAFGVDYSVRTRPDGTPEVSHSGDVLVVDDTGTVVLAWPRGTGSSRITGDLERLLQGERPVSATGGPPPERTGSGESDHADHRPGA